MTTQAPPFNAELADRIRASGGTLAGSLYAVPAAQRASAADLLHRHGAWVHADVFDDPGEGVDVDLIAALAAARLARLDIHLLTAGALAALDLVCRPGVDRITFPFEGVAAVGDVAARIRAAGVSPWLAVAPGTSLVECAEASAHVDGLLVMLLEPGTRRSADLRHLSKVENAHAGTTVGVDGGVREVDLDRILAAGATYIVAGRRLFTSVPARPQVAS
ncbi:hypothetical protein [Nakamurella deserti]|uniref:hypothetical protein n=1 Tax=Nakamurella deserti TaxID=2164074 RepID=UPI0013004555|nr:hypothetical protein [Nakamurella deserti]